MRRTSFLLALLLTTTVSAAPPEGYRLVWEDHFNGDQLDASKWAPEKGLRRGHPLSMDAITVKDGVLTVTTFSERGKHHTGFLTTKGKFATTFGYFEARIRFRTSPGQWGAFWLHTPSSLRPSPESPRQVR